MTPEDEARASLLERVRKFVANFGDPLVDATDVAHWLDISIEDASEALHDLGLVR